MNIGNKYLRSWLRFDESATKDFIADNQWTVSGNPTISTTNAISGKALQLDGSSYLKLSGVELAGRPFTIDCVAYVNSSSPNNARLFSIIDPTTGYHLASVRKSATQNAYIDAWANSYADCSQNNGYTTTVNAITGVNNRVHVALVYYPDYTSSLSRLLICVGGYVYTINSTKSPKYNRNAFDIVIGALPNGNQGIIGSIDEFRIYDGVALFTNISGNNFTPPNASFYNTHEFWIDAIRMPSIPASEWRYNNIGEIDTLINTTTAVQLTDLPATQSRTGKAFYQTTQTKIFDVPTSKEVWVKFDVYFDGVNRWRAYDISTGSGQITGITAQTSGDISFFNRNTNKYQWSNWAKINALQTVMLHMIADSTNGLIEAYTDDGGLLYAYTGEVNNGTNFSTLYLQSDGSGTFFSSVEISNNPLWIDGKNFYSKIDSIRMPRIPATLWQYENAGTIGDLINTNTAVQVDNLPPTKSKTGSAFHQTTENISLFNIPTNSAEVWIKFDVYSQSYGWYVWDCSNYNVDETCTGLMVFYQNSSESIVRVYTSNNNSVDVSIPCINGELRAFVLHMIADSTDGVIELFSDRDGLIYSYKGAVNSGQPFAKIDMISGVNSSDIDLFSNVIISNNPLWVDYNAAVFLVDTEREIGINISLLFDTSRELTNSQTLEVFSVDAERIIQNTTVILADAERRTGVIVSFKIDAERETIRTEIVDVDASRIVCDNSITTIFSVDLERLACEYAESITANFDAERKIAAVISFLVDALRQIPHAITAGVTSGLASVSVSINEQQLTDKITLSYAADIDILDGVNLTLLDYNMRGRVEEISTRGIQSTAQLMTNIDEILYQQMAYTIPESEWEFTDEFLEYARAHGAAIPSDPDYEGSDLKAEPFAAASTHIEKIAESLGLNVSLRFSDFISTMSTDVKSGTNYAGLIEELFGWTSRLPQRLINVYLRGNTLHVVQRGYEGNTVTLDGQKLTVHTVNKKLMRTTWGSETWSETEVKPYYDNWIEGETTPLNDDSGSGTTYNNDGLVEETVVEHGEETVVTTYTYTTLENGQKFLSQEVATTYVGGEMTDQVVTTHDPVRDTQSHVYATDDSGVLGSVVTSSNNDDRVTPFQGAHSRFQGGLTVTDMNGDKFLLWRLTYHSDKIDKMKRTVYGVSLIDTSFPVDGQDTLEELTNEIMWLDRKIEESVTLDVYDYPHIIDFNDKIIWNGNTYYLRSNTAIKSESIVNKQTLNFVRWY